MLIMGRDITEVFFEILSQIDEIEGGYTRLIILFVSLITIAFLNRKDIGRVCIPVIVCFLLLLSPHLYVYLFQDTSYKRFFWTLPEAIALSYALILVLSRLKKRWHKTVSIICIVSVLSFSGISIYSEEAGYFGYAENIEHVEPSIATLAETIVGIKSNPACVVPIQAAQMIRVANPNITQVAGRNYLGYMGYTDPVISKLVTNVSSLTPDSDYIFSVANSKKLDIVVTLSAADIDESVSCQYGYENYGDVGEYTIYYNPNPGPVTNEWYITQYGPNWGKNYFYTIEDTQGNLVIIDGGHYGNSEIIRNIIRDHDYQVSAWIITTLSDNHTGAAYDILCNDLDLITIDKIYVQDYSDKMIETINSNSAGWEENELKIASDFNSLLGQFDNVVYVEEGEDYDLLGLKLHIYHTWDENVEIIGSRESSNSSLVFSISGNEDSMLFTSYTTLPIENDIFEAVGETQFEYITVNDHGEWTYDYWWYDSKNPIGLFIDQDATQLNPGGRAYNFYSYAIEKGYNVYTFVSVPNRITIR